MQSVMQTEIIENLGFFTTPEDLLYSSPMVLKQELMMANIPKEKLLPFIQNVI